MFLQLKAQEVSDDQVSVFSARARYRVVKIARSSFEVVL
jgi:hypothetical protein